MQPSRIKPFKLELRKIISKLCSRCIKIFFSHSPGFLAINVEGFVQLTKQVVHTSFAQFCQNSQTASKLCCNYWAINYFNFVGMILDKFLEACFLFIIFAHNCFYISRPAHNEINVIH